MPTPDNSAERPDQSVAERLAEQSSKARESAEWAVVTGGDDFQIAGELQKVNEAQLAEINHRLKDEGLVDHDREVLEEIRGGYLESKQSYEQAVLSGELSDQVREQVESYREGVQETIEEVVDGDLAGLSEASVKRFRDMAKELIRSGFNANSA